MIFIQLQLNSDELVVYVSPDYALESQDKGEANLEQMFDFE